MTVIVKRHAFASAVDVDTSPPAAIQTKGRSEAHRITQMDDPARVVVLGRNGHLPAPTTLERVGARGRGAARVWPRYGGRRLANRNGLRARLPLGAHRRGRNDAGGSWTTLAATTGKEW